MARLTLPALVGVMAFMASPALAQDLPETRLQVIGSLSNLNGYKTIELPFWTEEIPRESGGKVAAEIVPLDQLNLQGPEVLRLLQLNTADVVSVGSSYISGDMPAMEGVDLVGLFPDLPTLRMAAEAYRPVIAELFTERMGARLLSIWALPSNVLFCRTPVESMEDLRGRKIRSWSASLGSLIEGLGAVPVSVSFPETVPALERGTLDCAPTGILSGNNARWWEVAPYLYPLPMGSGLWLNAVNLDRWNAMPPELQDFILTHSKAMEDRLWELAADETSQGIACHTGVGVCDLGVSADKFVNEVSDEDKARFAEIVAESVLSDWADRCGPECAARWDETVGSVLGLKASQ